MDLSLTVREKCHYFYESTMLDYNFYKLLLKNSVVSSNSSTVVEPFKDVKLVPVLAR